MTQPLDDETPQGKFLSTLLAAQAQLDNDLRRDRTVEGMKATVQRGYWPYRAKLGFKNARDESSRPILVPDPETAPLVRHAFEFYATGQYTMAELLQKLTAMGLRMPNGEPLSAQTLAKMLHSPIYVAELSVPKWGLVGIKASFDGLVDRKTFDSVQTHLSRRAHKAEKHQRDQPEFSLKRLVRCGKCQRPLTASRATSRSGRKYAYYHCQQKCEHVLERKDRLEDAVEDLVSRLQPTPEYLRLYKEIMLDVWKQRRKDRVAIEQRLTRRLEKLDQRKDRLIEAFVYHRTIDAATFEKQEAKLARDILATEQELGEAREDTLNVKGIIAYAEHVALNVATQWRDATYEQRIRLGRILFPKGLEYSGEGLQTPETGLFFRNPKDLDAPLPQHEEVGSATGNRTPV